MSRKTTAQNTTAQKEEIKTINAMDYQETDVQIRRSECLYQINN